MAEGEDATGGESRRACRKWELESAVRRSRARLGGSSDCEEGPPSASKRLRRRRMALLSSAKEERKKKQMFYNFNSIIQLTLR